MTTARLADFFSRLRVGTRIYAGFTVVVLLLALVSVATVSGLRDGLSTFLRYQHVVDIQQLVLTFDRDVIALRREIRAFVSADTETVQPLIGELRKKIEADLTNLDRELVGDERRKGVALIAASQAQYIDLLDKVIAAKRRIYQLRHKEMDPLGTEMRRALSEVTESAMAARDFETAAEAGLAVQYLMQVRVNEMRLLDRDDAKAADAIVVNLTDTKRALTALAARVQTDALQASVTKVAAGLAKYQAAFAEAAARKNELLNITGKEMPGVAAELARNFRDLGQSANAELDDTAARSQTSLNASVTTGLGFSVAALIVAVVLAWLIARSIVTPVTAMTAAMGRLASGDIGTEIPARERGDEIGRMAAAVQIFKDNLIDTKKMAAAQEEAEKRAAAEKRALLERLAAEFEQAVGGIVRAVASAANQMQSAAQSLSSTAERTSRQSLAVAASAQQASGNVQTVASAGEELATSIREIGLQVAESTKIAGKAVDDAGRTNATVTGLAEAAQKIGDVVKLINDIAGQTNLLALNATIEAARAGEAGKGFAVVASEVKSLANQTAKATDEIAQQIQAIQGATQDSVDAIKAIGATIGQISDIATAVAGAVEEQGAATQEIARNVQQAAKGTQEVSTNISGVTQASKETGTAANQVLAASGELARQAEMLRHEVDAFVAKVRAA